VAPDRLDVYYWFCLEHVRAYNTAWNYCAGMNDAEVEANIRADAVGRRPTWPLGELGGRFSRIRFDRLREELGLFGDGGKDRAQNGRRPGNGHEVASDHGKALLLFDLAPPVTMEVLKARYKELVKLHHPDANGGDKEAEERLKLINRAYATLRDALGA
jgi:hypothetical protein